VATVGLVTLASRWFGFRRDEHAVLLLCVALCNSSFIGYPMVQALLGEHALPYAVVYDQFGTFVLLSTFGLYVLARYGGDAPPTLRRSAAHAAVPAGVGIAAGPDVMPASRRAGSPAACELADALLPLVMLAVGLTIQLRLPRDEVKPLAVGLVLRLLVLPALALPLSLAFGLRGEMLQANVLESAMPSMITAAALAISHQLAPRLAAALVGYGILLSLADAAGVGVALGLGQERLMGTATAPR
jgi:predicted permease